MSKAELPPGWVWTTLGELGDWVGGGTPSKANPNYWTAGTIPWVSPKDMKRDVIEDAEDHITAAAVSASSTQLVPAGSVLIVTRSGILQHTVPVAVTAREVALNQDLKAVVPQGGIEPRYVAAFVRSHQHCILASCSKAGTTVASIALEALKAYGIPLPPLAEQRRIVAKLDTLLASIRAAGAALDAVPALLEQHRQAVLADAFNGHLTQNWRAENSHHVIERRMVSFETLTTSLRGGTAATSLKVATRWPVLRSSAVRPGQVDLTDCSFLPEHQSPSTDHLLSDGDVLISRLSGSLEYVGNAAIVCGLGERQIAYPDRLFRARLAPDVDPTYVTAAFQCRRLRTPLEEAAKSSAGHQRISLSDVRRFQVPVVSLEEQREIGRRLTAHIGLVDRLRKSAEIILGQLELLQQSVLAKAFCGELVPQDPTDESASVLLERIRAEREEAPARRSRRGIVRA